MLTFADCEQACIPAAALGRLAALRTQRGVEVALHDRQLWVRWEPGQENVARALLPVAGCRLYGRHDDQWHRLGAALPAFDVPPALRFRPLYEVLFPAPMEPISASEFSPVPAALTLVADAVYRPTRALRCPLDRFLLWAEGIPACALARWQGAIQGERLFVLGNKLPWLEDDERFWGQAVLVPIGWRPQPFLAEADLRLALDVAETDLLVLHRERTEVIATDGFSPLTHAALRLARAGGAP